MKNDYRDYLCHYGVKGMKWGIRRYQNSNGSLTEDGKKRYKSANRVRRLSKNENDVEDIINSMSKKDKYKVLAGSKDYLKKEQLSNVSKRVIIRDKDKKPIAFFDCMDDGKEINIALGTRNGQQYRNKGYASKATKSAIKYLKRTKHPKQKVVWGVMTNNKASIRLAEKHGFKIDNNSYSKDNKWVNYVAFIKDLKE